MTKKVAVVGASGMLGSMVVEYLAKQPGYQVTAVVRDSKFADWASKKLPEVRFALGGINDVTGDIDFNSVKGSEWVVNAIGITKPLIKDDNFEQIERAVAVNVVFPHRLARLAAENGAKVIQIATDCVYSGAKGDYTEVDLHDCTDVYGKTKSLGECYMTNVHHLRCSIIGPELKDRKFLLEWFLKQPQNSSVNGFSNHSWNGVTTLHFAKLCKGIVESSLNLSHLQHVIPSGSVTKAEMLESFAKCYGRSDILVKTMEAPMVLARTLRTKNEETNKSLWSAAGYTTPPTVPQMIEELSKFAMTLRS